MTGISWRRTGLCLLALGSISSSWLPERIVPPRQVVQMLTFSAMALVDCLGLAGWYVFFFSFLSSLSSAGCASEVVNTG